MMDRASRLAARDARIASQRAKLKSIRDAANERRVAKGKKPIDFAAADARYGRYGAKKMASGGDVMDDKMGRAMSKRGDMSDKMGRAMARGMKAGGDVKKMQAGGMAERRAAREARIAEMRSKMDARRKGRPISEGTAAMRAKHDAARQARYAQQDARIAARNRARGIGGSAAPEMKSGGKVKKYAEGGAIYRKAADGVATKGKTKGTQIKMRKGGMC